MELGNQKGCRAVENCAHRRARSGGVSSVEKNKIDRQKAINEGCTDCEIASMNFSVQPSACMSSPDASPQATDFQHLWSRSSRMISMKFSSELHNVQRSIRTVCGAETSPFQSHCLLEACPLAHVARHAPPIIPPIAPPPPSKWAN